MPVKRLALGLALGFAFLKKNFFGQLGFIFVMIWSQQVALKPLGLVLSGVNNRKSTVSFQVRLEG